MKKIQSKKCMLGIGAAIVFFLILVSYIYKPFFASDEGDVYLLGRSVANGLLIYRDVTSQHMPVMYYIAAIFSKCGAVTVTQFRLCFYVLFACAWGGIFAVYAPTLGYKEVGIGAVMYLLLIGHIDMGYTVLSEQLQAIGMVILLYELILFEKKLELSGKSIAMISVAIFISFGSAFVSIFAIGFVVIIVFMLEIQQAVRNKRSPSEVLTDMLKKYWKLIVAVICPFVLLIGYYLFTGTLGDFWGMAYTLNREVYPKYLGGYGDSIFKTIWNGIVYVLSAFKLWSDMSSLMNIVQTLLMVLVLYFAVYIQRKRKNIILTLGTLVMLSGSATRGIFNFHGLAACALICAMASFPIVDISNSIKNVNIKYTAVVLITAGIAMNSVNVWKSLDNKDDNQTTINTSITHAIKLIADRNEIVGFSTLSTNEVFESETLPSLGNAACPWIWDWVKTCAMEQYSENPPRIFLYDPAYETWGYPIVEYASELNEFIEENYTSLNKLNYSELYVRNDYYDEAYEKITDDYKMQTGHNIPNVTVNLSEDHSKADIELDKDSYYESVQIAVWSDENGQDDLEWYDMTEADMNKWACTVDMAEHGSAGLYYIHVYGIHNGVQEFVVGTSVEI